MGRITRLAMAAILGVTFAPGAASACGGFFCSQTPIEQTGERVLFGVSRDGMVKAHIQIFYQGEAEKFAWVLPVPAEPQAIGVGTDQLFSQLDNTYRPTFSTQWTYQNDCYYSGGGWGDDADFAPSAGAGGAEEGGRQGVEVLQADAVGPYDYVVLKGTGEGGGGEAMFKWLNDNGFDQDESAKSHIMTYAAENHVFVAIKLQQDAGVGDIAPLTMEYKMPAGCVPLRLTSIAAMDDMDVWVYMLGNHRAVPINYLHTEINEAKIDWINYGQNYDEVAREAVDIASGRAFLTEYAGDTNEMQGVLWKPGLYDTKPLLEEKTPWGFVNKMLQLNYPRTPAMQNLIRTHIPKPDSLSKIEDRDFYNNLENYSAELEKQKFDPSAFVADIWEKIFNPLEEASELFAEYDYLTRMYTVISPNEMTRDPIFLFNPDLGNVNRIHRAVATAVCKPGSNYEAEEVKVTLEDGTELTYKVPEQWGTPPELIGGDDAVKAAVIQQMFTEGPAEIVALVDVAKKDLELDGITLALFMDGDTEEPKETPRTGDSQTAGPSAGCTAGANGSWGGMAVMFLMIGAGLVAVRRRLFA